MVESGRVRSSQGRVCLREVESGRDRLECGRVSYSWGRVW